MPERMEAVRRAAERWRDQLIDVSGRNRLLNYSDLKGRYAGFDARRSIGSLCPRPGKPAEGQYCADDRAFPGRGITG